MSTAFTSASDPNAPGEGLGWVIAAVMMGAASSALAMGPAAPFTPPRAAAPVLAQGTGSTGPARAENPAAKAVAPAPEPALEDAALQGVRTGTQAMALIDGRWWPLGSGPGGRRITAIDSKGIWISLGTAQVAPAAQHAPARQQRLQLLPNTALTPTATTHTPVLTASAHGARP